MAGKRLTSMGFSRVPCSGSKDLKEGEGELSVLSLSLASGRCSIRYAVTSCSSSLNGDGVVSIGRI